MPSWTIEGVFGIARTTGTGAARCDSMNPVEIAATTDSSV
jgi:hypothetical protein